MPAEYGKVSKAFIKNRQSSVATNNPLSISIYTLGIDSNGKLVSVNDITKLNLSRYLQQYRMLTDNIDILNAYIINIQVKFDIIVNKGHNAQQVLLNCMLVLQQFFKIQK